jgi:hypothetical protein
MFESFYTTILYLTSYARTTKNNGRRSTAETRQNNRRNTATEKRSRQSISFKEQRKTGRISQKSENPEKMRAYKRKWQKNNPLKYKLSKIRDRYGEAGVQAYLRDGGKCAKCGKIAEGVQSSLHHKDWNPDNNVIENLITLCKKHHTMVHFFVPVPPEVKIEWLNQFFARKEM